MQPVYLLLVSANSWQSKLTLLSRSASMSSANVKNNVQILNHLEAHPRCPFLIQQCCHQVEVCHLILCQV